MEKGPREEIPTKPRSHQTPSYNNPKESDISVYQQNILISKDFNLKSQSVKKLDFSNFSVT